MNPYQSPQHDGRKNPYWWTDLRLTILDIALAISVATIIVMLSAIVLGVLGKLDVSIVNERIECRFIVKVCIGISLSLAMVNVVVLVDRFWPEE